MNFRQNCILNDSTDRFCMMATGWRGNWLVCWKSPPEFMLSVAEVRDLRAFTPPTIPILLNIHLRGGRCLLDGRQVEINDTIP